MSLLQQSKDLFVVFFFFWIAGLCIGFHSNKIYQFKMLAKKKVELDFVGYGSQRCFLVYFLQSSQGGKGTAENSCKG